jgi:outer membrane protein OmpA-like peptidoglycan-associated protein/tetratricopeptide (TPR) repeat protein
MRKLIIFFVLISATFFNGFAQIDKEKAIRPKQELKIADLLYAQGHFYSAIEYYKEYLRQKPENRYAKYWLAMSYLNAAEYSKAKQTFNSFHIHTPGPKESVKRIEKENKEMYGLSKFYYGVALKHNEDYEEAIRQLRAFKASYLRSADDEKKKKKADGEDWLARAEVEIKGAELGLENLPLRKVKVKPLSSNINTAYTEAGPFPVNDTLMYYTSMNKNELVFVNKVKEIPHYDLYQSEKVDGEWQKGKKMPEMFNDPKFSTGTVALSEDGNRMYFSKCHNNEVDEVICNLFISVKNKSGKWQEPEKLNNQINSPKYTSTHPTVRSSGDNMDMVYFVSDREGGVGGMDIWYFIRTAKGDYKGPRNLKGVNTKYDELTPFYDNDEEMLYFSSNGHPSLGGFDVFKTYEDEDLQWSSPKNVGKPINSPADDLFYRREFGKTSGFLVSNREGTTLVNKMYPGDDIFYFEDFKYGLEGFVFREEKGGDVPLDGSTVKLYEIDEQGNEQLLSELEDVSQQYFFTLKPDRDYKVELSKPGYSMRYEVVSTKDLPYEDTIVKNLSVNRTVLQSSGAVFAETDTLKKSKLTDVVVTLIEILPSGVERTLSAQKLTDKSPEYKFDLTTGKDYLIIATKDGFFKSKVSVSTKNLTEDPNRDIFLAKIEKDKSYELENILYDFGKATLRDESKKVLDGLLEIMRENPTIIVELSAHTDNIGSDEANLKLSQARAQSCVDYLVSKGISKERLIAKGYGKSVPVAPNQNEDGSDNPEGRQKNRRTEFKVIGGF